MITHSARRILFNLLGVLVILGLLAGLIVLLGQSFGIGSWREILAQVVTVRTSAILLMAFATINFLFIINLLHASNTQNKKEQQIDRVKSEFISLVSHQLRTPLSAVNWYTEALSGSDMGTLNKDQQEYLARVRESSRRMTTLVNSILEVSRIEMNTFVVDLQPTNMITLAEQVIGELNPQIQAKKLSLKEHFGDNMKSVTIDPRYAHMIIDNLLSNAIKYTPDGGVIDLTITYSENKLHITVADNGYGIPTGEADKVFTKMFRGHNILDKDTDGTGLGLYIVQSIVHYAGGTITFKSIENEGTTFFVVLPTGDTGVVKKSAVQ